MWTVLLRAPVHGVVKASAGGPSSAAVCLFSFSMRRLKTEGKAVREVKPVQKSHTARRQNQKVRGQGRGKEIFSSTATPKIVSAPSPNPPWVASRGEATQA